MKCFSAITIDPGINFTGLAFWKMSVVQNRITMPILVGSQLLQINVPEFDWMLRAQMLTSTFRSVVESFERQNEHGVFPLRLVACEYPEYYETSNRGKTAAQSGSLIKLAALAGMLLGCVQNIKTTMFIGVRAWKGQTPKQGIISRIKKRLGENHEVLKYARKDEFDAIGIGLWISDHYLSGTVASSA